MGKWDSERQLLWEVTQEMAKAGLVAGSSGNASLKLPGDGDQELVLITPTGLPYRQLGTDDLVVIDLEGEHIEGHLLPSSETALHLAIYKEREDAGAVIHTHSLFASVAAVAGLEIPPLIDEMVISVGGSVRVAEYGFPSTEDLARKSCLALGDRNAALLRNHGMVGMGRTLWEAFGVCQLVERVAQIFTYASLMGRAIPLPPDIVEREQEMFRMQRAASLHAGGHHNTHHNNEEVD